MQSLVSQAFLCTGAFYAGFYWVLILLIAGIEISRNVMQWDWKIYWKIETILIHLLYLRDHHRPYQMTFLVDYDVHNESDYDPDNS